MSTETRQPVQPSMAVVPRRVVARLADGRTTKGTTLDFSPTKDRLHIYVNGDETVPAITVRIDALKALFYVKTYEGSKDYDEGYDFDKITAHGRKVAVVFHDGEIIAGFTMGYNPTAQGFFVIPADPQSNNSRVYIVNRAVKQIQWL